MKDLVEFAELVRTKLLAEGQTCLVLWGRAEASNHDKQGPGTANRVVVYDGPPDEAKGQWIRHTNNKGNAAKREQPGQFYRWQRVTLDVWHYNGAPPVIALDGGTEDAAQFRAKDSLMSATERAALQVVKEQGHEHTFYEDVVNNRSTPTDRRHGDRAIFSFEIAFVACDPTPTIDKFKESKPILTGVMTTPTATITEITPP